MRSACFDGESHTPTLLFGSKFSRISKENVQCNVFHDSEPTTTTTTATTTLSVFSGVYPTIKLFKHPKHFQIHLHTMAAKCLKIKSPSFAGTKIGFFYLWHACILLLASAGCDFEDVPYDYSATTECLEEPWEVQYCNGGIIYNSKFDNGTQGWKVYGQGGKIQKRVSKNGNNFIVALRRTKPSDSPSQVVNLKEGLYYAFSAWIQVSEGSEIVSVIFRGRNGVALHGGTVIAEKGCWSMLKGGIISTFSGLADLTFETENAAVELWLDSAAVWPFTRTQWRSHHQETNSKVRKRKVKFHVTVPDNISLEGATVSLSQIKPEFPLGSSINAKILNNTLYQDWFTSRFTVTAFNNEMKWYSTEKTQAIEDYSIPDAMLQLCETNNISVRGHNIIWDDPSFQPQWINGKTTVQVLKEASEKRTRSVVSRYKKRVISWDVVNENLHFRFYEDKLGENASAEFYAKTYEIDQKTPLFMNEYNTIEISGDKSSIPAKYARKMKKIVSYYRQVYSSNITLPMAIGLQTRFPSGQPNLVYMRAGMDYLASMGYPLWLTEVFLKKGDNQEYYLEDVLREGYGHPGVEGIVIWPTPALSGGDCQMCLTDENFKNTANGDVVDKLIKEWMSSKPLEMSTNLQGYSEEMLLLHGDYEISVRHPNASTLSTKLKLKVSKRSPNRIIHLHLGASF